MLKQILRPMASALVIGALSGNAAAAFVVRAGSGPDAASITPTVTQFRADLGEPNNGNALGPLPDGRREINWDGGGAAAPATLFPSPMQTFNTPPVNRGAVFTTPGSGFEISGQPTPEIGDINASYPGIFNTFSAPRLFSPLGSNITDVFFFIPGTNIPAVVSGFGAVFTDVDLPETTRIQFFGLGGELLFDETVLAGPTADESLSFLGATATAGESIFRVRITSGTTPLGPNDNPAAGADIVALDDFLFSEPAAVVAQVPEPGSAVLTTAVLLAFGFVRSCRRGTRRPDTFTLADAAKR